MCVWNSLLSCSFKSAFLVISTAVLLILFLMLGLACHSSNNWWTQTSHWLHIRTWRGGFVSALVHSHGRDPYGVPQLQETVAWTQSCSDSLPQLHSTADVGPHPIMHGKCGKHNRLQKLIKLINCWRLTTVHKLQSFLSYLQNGHV